MIELCEIECINNLNQRPIAPSLVIIKSLVVQKLETCIAQDFLKCVCVGGGGGGGGRRGF